jgi:N-acetyl-gamma-glutamyl-phosphate reductase
MRRGINSTIVAAPGPNFAEGAVTEALNDAYADEPFVQVLPCGSTAETKHVETTNTCEIGHAFDEHSGKIVITSAIDNLTKGASGQAVQCANIAFGLDETAGL